MSNGCTVPVLIQRVRALHASSADQDKMHERVGFFFAHGTVHIAHMVDARYFRQMVSKSSADQHTRDYADTDLICLISLSAMCLLTLIY